GRLGISVSLVFYSRDEVDAGDCDAATCMPSGPAKWHATQRPGRTCRHSGSWTAHSGCAYWQRVRKRQPDGGAMGLGISPCRTMRSPCRMWAGSGEGSADNKAWV